MYNLKNFQSYILFNLFLSFIAFVVEEVDVSYEITLPVSQMSGARISTKYIGLDGSRSFGTAFRCFILLGPFYFVKEKGHFIHYVFVFFSIKKKKKKKKEKRTDSTSDSAREQHSAAPTV